MQFHHGQISWTYLCFSTSAPRGRGAAPGTAGRAREGEERSTSPPSRGGIRGGGRRPGPQGSPLPATASQSMPKRFWQSLEGRLSTLGTSHISNWSENISSSQSLPVANPTGQKAAYSTSAHHALCVTQRQVFSFKYGNQFFQYNNDSLWKISSYIAIPLHFWFTTSRTSSHENWTSHASNNLLRKKFLLDVSWQFRISPVEKKTVWKLNPAGLSLL